MAQASSLNEQVRDKASNSGRKMLEQEDIVVATGLSFGEDRPCGSRPVKTSASKTADSVASSQDAPTGYYATNTASQPDPKFAKGHSRIVSFNDGTKDCIGILISRNFFTIIIHTARSRHVVQEKQSAVEQAELDVRRVLNSIDGPAILSEAIAKEREATRVRQEIEDGIPELVEARQQVDFLRRELLDPELGLDYDRDGSQAILERVFQQGGLLNFYTSPIRAASVNLGPKGRVAGSQTSSELSCYADSLHPLEYSSDHTFLNPYQRALEDLSKSRQTLAESQTQMDCRKQYYAEDLSNYHQAIAEKVFSFTQTEFDCRHVEIGRQLTRQLIDAEEAHEDARKRAKAQGIDPDEIGSWYGSLYAPSLAGSRLDVLIQQVDRAKIEAWIEKSSRPCGLEVCEPTDVDDCDTRSVEVFDSCSAIASDYYYRKRIDRWEEIRRSCRGQADPPQKVGPKVRIKESRKRRRSW